MSKQAWGIVDRIRAVDGELRAHPRLQRRTHEVHPEVAFQAWNGAPIPFGKRSLRGREQRRRLVDRHFGPSAYDAVRARFPARNVAHDDILDAFATLWSAERILRGEGRSLPESPPTDEYGLRMEIVY
jgi:predicted RNase H-like nuclease